MVAHDEITRHRHFRDGRGMTSYLVIGISGTVTENRSGIQRVNRGPRFAETNSYVCLYEKNQPGLPG